MSIAGTSYGASAPLDHRLSGRERKVVLTDLKNAIRWPESPRRAHTLSPPIAPIASAQRAPGLISNDPILGVTETPNSNPHSLMPLLALFHTPAVSSLEAYQTPTADQSNRQA